MKFAIVDVAYPPPLKVVGDVQPVQLDEIPERDDVVIVSKSGCPVRFRVRWVSCTRIAIFPDNYPKVDKILAGVFND